MLMPFILLLLGRVSAQGAHGYELAQQLAECGFDSLDKGNIYRLLRQMEKDNLLSSNWDTSGPGPAKRLYLITDVGQLYLKSYAGQMERYQSLLQQFFDMYSGLMDLYIPSFFKKKKQEERVEVESKGKNRDK
ncbi:PadR family transcriptional regulator [bacterium LRH843]|nr:PadR family transcriptional regulator [bacterium LRH843]